MEFSFLSSFSSLLAFALLHLYNRLSATNGFVAILQALVALVRLVLRAFALAFTVVESCADSYALDVGQPNTISVLF